MKIKVNHFDKKVFEDKLQHLSHLDFSLFIDAIPEDKNELSNVNIISFQEPNEYFGLHDWVIKNKDIFSVILTWDDKVLNQCDNAMFQPFGHTWLKPDQYEKEHSKEFKLAHLQGKLLKTYGHSLRHEVTARENEFKIPTKFYKTYGDRNNIDDITGVISVVEHLSLFIHEHNIGESNFNLIEFKDLTSQLNEGVNKLQPIANQYIDSGQAQLNSLQLQAHLQKIKDSTQPVTKAYIAKVDEQLQSYLIELENLKAVLSNALKAKESK